MIVTVHLSATLDAEFRGQKKTAGSSAETSRPIRELLAAHGLKLKPLFSDSAALAGGHVWHLECPDARAPEIVEKLLRTTGVEGAYVKPPDELPGPP